MKLLVTGGAGFIGSNFILYMMQSIPITISWIWMLLPMQVIWKTWNRLRITQTTRSFKQTDKPAVDAIFQQGINVVVNFAAESRGSRFWNRRYAWTLMCWVHRFFWMRNMAWPNLSKYPRMKYGSLGETGLFSETTPLAPNSPYSASKAGDLLVSLSWDLWSPG